MSAVSLAMLALAFCGCDPASDSKRGAQAEKNSEALVASVDDEAQMISPPIKIETAAPPGSAIEKGPENAFSARFLCWNIESEGSYPRVIANQVKAMGSYDVYAFTEFLPDAEKLFVESLGERFQLVVSRSGHNDRLATAFDKRVFDLVKVFEIEEINFKHRYRAPLVVHLKEKRTGIEFYVMNNHLARGKEQVRDIQAEQLVQWARVQLLPTVALGDYNFDYVFETEKGNSAFAKMLKDNVWKWIKPVELVDTNWYDNPQAPDGFDDYPGSMLDFAFVSGPAKAWKMTCRIIVRPGDFPDDETTSDHRPFELIIEQ